MSGPSNHSDEFDDLPELVPLPFLFDNDSDDNREVLDETQPRHYDIVPHPSAGDVIWECKDKVSFLVSSAVLRLTSRYFKTLLDGNFKEGQVLRTAANPQRVPSGEENSYALRRLFCLLHHQPDPDPHQNLIDLSKIGLGSRVASAARKLREFALVVDYCECSGALSKVTDSMLHEFAVANLRHVVTFQVTADLVSAAYKLENSRYFRLFTKRLLTDHTERFEDADLAVGVPKTRIILELTRQSIEAWKALGARMQQLDTGKCTSHPNPHTGGVRDHLWMQKLNACLLPPLIAWPSRREDGISLRRMLTGIHSLERIQRVSWCAIHGVHIFGSVDQQEFALLCRMTDAEVSGVCLTCLRSPEDGSAMCRCRNDADTVASFSAALFVRRDSFLAKVD